MTQLSVKPVTKIACISFYLLRYLGDIENAIWRVCLSL